ncbi:MAG: hypothetical protein ABI925_04610 [Verrucomicrobiota bacterium]
MKLILILAALLAVGVVSKPTANALDLSINIGDQGFYDGASYWDDGYFFVWRPGHREHGHWVHGEYVRKGEFHKEYAHQHHHRHHDNDHDHDRH